MITCGTLFIPIVGCQLDQGLFRFLIEYRENSIQKNSIFSSIVVVDIIISLVFFVLLSLVGTIRVFKYGLFLPLYVILQIFISLFMQFARGIGNNKIYAIGSFLSATMTIVFNILLLVIIKMGLEGLFVATISAQTLTLFYLCFALKPWRYFGMRFIKISIIKSIAKYSVPLIPNELSWWVVNVSDRVIVSFVLGVAVNGIYTIANKFSSLFISFFNIFNLSWTETVSLHYSDDDGEIFLSETMTIMFKLFSSIGLGVVAIMPFAFPILINKKYEEAYNQIIILIYAMLLRVIVGLYSAVYVATKETKKIAYTSASAALINIVVNLLLINKIGLYAASISTMVAFGVTSVIRIVDINRKVRINISRNVYIVTIIVAGVLAITYYINNVVINIFMCICVCIYAITMNYDILKYLFKMIGNFKNGERQ